MWIADEEKPLKHRHDALRQYNMLVCLMTVLDLVWILWMTDDWLCSEGEVRCFDGINERLRYELPLHHFAIGASWLNAGLKVVLIILQCLWLREHAPGVSSSQFA